MKELPVDERAHRVHYRPILGRYKTERCLGKLIRKPQVVGSIRIAGSIYSIGSIAPASLTISHGSTGVANGVVETLFTR
jgi:hypothetical protein